MTRLTLVEKIPDEALEPRLQTNLGRALYNNPPLCIAFKSLATGVHGHSSLDHRLRELVILRISAALRSDVEWGHHFRSAITRAGVAVAEARDVRDGKLDGFSARERAAMEYGQAFDENRIDDAAWARVSEHFTQAEILDLTLLAGLYGLAGRLTNGLGVPMDDGILPISAVESLL